MGVGDDNTPNGREPRNLTVGVTVVGKRARIPAGVAIGRNCRIDANVADADFGGAFVPSGGTVTAGRAPVGRYAARPGRASEVAVPAGCRTRAVRRHRRRPDRSRQPRGAGES